MFQNSLLMTALWTRPALCGPEEQGPPAAQADAQKHEGYSWHHIYEAVPGTEQRKDVLGKERRHDERPDEETKSESTFTGIITNTSFLNKTKPDPLGRFWKVHPLLDQINSTVKQWV
jgi:hypothetical protein